MLTITAKQPADAHIHADDQVSLIYEQRQKGRFKAVSDQGMSLAIFLERGQCLQDGELLQAETGELIRVKAADETVITGHCADPLVFAKICYHLGNRHVPLQVEAGWLRFQPDHVLEELVNMWGMDTVHEQAPFNPENGAYGAHRGHHHHH